MGESMLRLRVLCLCLLPLLMWSPRATHAQNAAGSAPPVDAREAFRRGEAAYSAGNYEVRLYFAEIWGGAFGVGQRVFDVAVNGQVVLDGYDVFAEVGANKGVVKSFEVNDVDQLVVQFSHVTENPAIKGIEVLSLGEEPSEPAEPEDPGPSELGATPASVDFPSVEVGQSAAESVTLSNLGSSGDSDIEVTGVTLTGANPGQSQGKRVGASTSDRLGGPCRVSGQDYGSHSSFHRCLCHHGRTSAAAGSLR
jgi:hypothetical protein